MEPSSLVISLIDRNNEVELRCDSNAPATLDGLVSDDMLRNRFRKTENGRAFKIRFTHEGTAAKILDELYKHSWKMGTTSLKAGTDGKMQKTYYLHKPVINGRVVNANNHVTDNEISSASDEASDVGPSPKQAVKSKQTTPTLDVQTTTISPSSSGPPWGSAAAGSNDPSPSEGAGRRSTSISAANSLLHAISARKGATLSPSTMTASPAGAGTGRSASRGSGAPIRTADMLIRDVMSPRSRLISTAVRIGTGIHRSGGSEKSASPSGVPSGVSGVGRTTEAVAAAAAASSSAGRAGSYMAPALAAVVGRFGGAGHVTGTYTQRDIEKRHERALLNSNDNIDRLMNVKSRKEKEKETIEELEAQVMDLEEMLEDAHENERSLKKRLSDLEFELDETTGHLHQIENRARAHAEEVAKLIWNQRKSEVETEAKETAEAYYKEILKVNTERAKEEADEKANTLWEQRKSDIIEAAMRKAESAVGDKILAAERTSRDATSKFEALQDSLVIATRRIEESERKAEEEKQRRSSDLAEAQRKIEELAFEHADVVATDLWETKRAALEKRLTAEMEAKYASAVGDARREGERLARDAAEARLQAAEARAAELEKDLAVAVNRSAPFGDKGMNDEEVRRLLAVREAEVSAALHEKHQTELATLRAQVIRGGAFDDLTNREQAPAGQVALEAAIRHYALDMARKVWERKKDDVILAAEKAVKGRLPEATGVADGTSDEVATYSEVDVRAIISNAEQAAEERAVNTAKAHFQEQWGIHSAQVQREAQNEAEDHMAMLWDEQKKQLEADARLKAQTQAKKTIDDLERRLQLAERRLDGSNSGGNFNAAGVGEDNLDQMEALHQHVLDLEHRLRDAEERATAGGQVGGESHQQVQSLQRQVEELQQALLSAKDTEATGVRRVADAEGTANMLRQQLIECIERAESAERNVELLHEALDDLEQEEVRKVEAIEQQSFTPAQPPKSSRKSSPTARTTPAAGPLGSPGLVSPEVTEQDFDYFDNN